MTTAADSDAAAGDSRAEHAMEPQDKLVVVVDDEVPLVDVICAALQEDGCQTTGCVRGQDAYPTIPFGGRSLTRTAKHDPPLLWRC